MKQILFDFFKNRHCKTKRCLGLLSFLMIALTGHKSFAQDYCTPVFTAGCEYSYISDFIIYGSGIEHTSSGCSTDGYGDFTGTSGLQGSLQQGETYTFSKTGAGFINNHQIKIWIDFNEDGDFEDEGELLFSSILNETTTTGSFTIPLTASVTSSTRLRIIANYNSLALDSCTVGDYGETQDYTVEILAAPDCQSPFAVNTFTGTNYTNIDWMSQGSAFQIEWGATGFTTGNGTLISDITGTSYTINGLTSNTAYQFYIRQNCGADGYSNWSGPYSFTTTTPEQIGNGNEFTTSYFPVTGWNDSYSYSQQIYLANELKAVLDENATFITKIRFKSVVLGTDPQNIENWTVYLGNTTKSSFANPTDWVAFSDLEYVFSGNLTFEEGEWIEIELYIPFAWDGVSNLVVAVDENSTGGSPGTSFAAFNVGTNRGISHYSNDNPNPALLSSVSGGVLPIIAQIQIEAIEYPACSTTALNAVPTLTTAFVSWTSTGSSFEVVYGESGFIIDEGTTVVNITTTNTTLTELTPDTYYDYYVRQDCEGEELLTGPFTFYTGYCIVDGTGTNYKIKSFSTSGGYENIANLDNGLNSYTNYSNSIYVSQSEGESFNYNIEVTSFTDVRFWVDWNNNLVFDEDELIIEHQFSTFSDETHTGTINIPENIPVGNYRLRIRTGSQEFSACDISNGEIEDYTITIVSPPSCVPPTNLTANNITLNSAELSWTSTGSLFNIEYGESGFVLGEGNFVSGVSTNTYVVTEIEQDKNYSYYVQTDCGNGDISFWSGPYTFYTGYCVAYTDLLEYGMIEGFSTQNGYINISNLDNGYEDNGYSDYTENYVTLSEGSTFIYNVDIMDGILVELWIDWNQNLLFDEEELVGQLSSSSYNGEITIPFGTLEGDYRLRIRSRSEITAPNANPCGGMVWLGETEDYTITVVTPPSCLPVINLGSTNISATSTSLFWQSSGGEYFDIEYGQLGFEQGTGTFVSEVGNPHTLTGLTNGINYQYYVRQNCGDDDYSIWRGPFKFIPGAYVGSIPTQLNENPDVSDEACNITFNIEVPEGQFLSALNVEYMMISTNPSFTSHQRSVLYSPTLGMGEENVAIGENIDLAGTQVYDRNITFANGSTGTIEFELKVWRTAGGTGCGTDLVHVFDGTWVLTPEFDNIPSCPDPPADLGYTNITENSVDLVWTAQEGEFQVKWGNSGFNVQNSGTIVSGITTNSLALSELDSNVIYEFYVRRDCSTEDEEDFGMWVGPLKFNAGYCIPTSGLAYYLSQFNTTNAVENITYSFSPPPGANLGSGYKDETDMIITQNAGNTFNFSSNYVATSSGLRIWIDWNNNYVFEDSEEVFYLGNGLGNKTGSITVPEDAVNGDYRMRVRVQEGATVIPPACGNIATGEAIDFTLRVQNGTNSIVDFNSFAFGYHPNPVSEMLYLRANTEINEVVVFNMLGQQLNLPIQSNKTQIDMTGLPFGNYVLSVTIEGVNKTFKVVKQ